MFQSAPEWFPEKTEIIEIQRPAYLDPTKYHR